MAQIYIPGVVHQRQLNRRACWYTCLQMVVRYYEHSTQQSHADLSGPENFPHMQARFQAGSNPSWAEWRAWAQQCGFEPLDCCPNEDGAYDILSRRGPIVYSGTWGNSFDGHVVVFTGIDTGGPTLYIDDPLEQNAPVSRNFGTYMAALNQTLYENPLFVRS